MYPQKNPPILPKRSKLLEVLTTLCYAWWTCCLWALTVSPSRRLVSLFVKARLHTGASQGKRKEDISVLYIHVPLYRWTNVSYIDDVLSLNNSKFDDFVDRIYPIELEIKDTIDTS